MYNGKAFYIVLNYICVNHVRLVENAAQVAVNSRCKGTLLFDRYSTAAKQLREA